MIKGETGGDGERSCLAPPRHRNPIDPVSKSIIEMLQVDGRRSYASIAAALGIAEDAVASGSSSSDAGVIQITAVSDPLQLGFARQAMIGINVEAPPSSRSPRRWRRSPRSSTSSSPPVASTSSPRWSGERRPPARAGDRRIRPIPGIMSIHTFLYLELQKQTYTWGVR